MPVGTVRGRVELDAPALRTLKELERQGIRTERQFKALGKETDRFAGKLVALDKEVKNQVRDLETLRRQGDRTMREMRDSWVTSSQTIKREVNAQQRYIRELEGSLDHLGARHATATVDIDGIAEALAQVELLESRLNSLGRTRATPRIALGGGFAGARGGVVRNAATSLPRLPRATNNGGFATRRGGIGGRGGGGGRGLRSVGVGPLNFGSAGGLALIGSALPAVQSLLGGAGALAGSAGMGLAGAGALGAVGAGGLAVGVGGLMSLIKPSIKPIQNAAKAQAAYNLQVAEYGRLSNQARVAKMKLDIAMGNAPRGTRQLLRETTALRAEWARETAPGRNALMGLAINGVAGARRFARNGGAAAVNRVGEATSREGQRFENFIFGRTGQRFAAQGAGIFDENLGNVRQSGQNVFTTWTNLMQAARPFFKESTAWLSKWTGGWAHSTNDIEGTRSKIGKMVDQLRHWEHLMGSIWRLTKDIGTAGAPSGGSLLESWTKSLDRWDEWIKRNPGQVQAFFRRSIDSTEKLGRAIATIARVVSGLATQLTPLLDRFTTLVSLAGSVGLLTPGAGALAMGAFRGVRGGRGGRGGGGGGFRGFLPFGGGGGGGAGGAGMAAEPAVATGQGAGAFGLSALYSRYKVNQALRGTTVMGSTLAERDAARVALAARAGQGLTLGGRVAGSTYGLARSFGYGRAAAGLAQAGALARGPLSRLGALGRAGAMGAIRGYVPIGLAFGALDAIGYRGNTGDKLRAGLSTFTLGAVPRPQTTSQGRDAGYQMAQDFLDPSNARAIGSPRYYTSTGVRPSVLGAQAEIGAIRNQIGVASDGLAVFKHFGTHGGNFGLQNVSTDLNVGGHKQTFTGATGQAKLQEYVNTLGKEMAARNQLISGLRREYAARAAGIGGQRAVELQTGYRRRVKREGAVAAYNDTLSMSRGEFGSLGDHGARAFAAQQLPFLRSTAKGNKALEAEYGDFEKHVIKRFHGLASHVAIINGQIKVGAASEWSSIADAIASAARSGVDRTSAEFQRLKGVAIGSLMSMGYGRAAAAGIFNLQGGSANQRGQARTVLRSGPGSYDAGIAAGRVAGPINPHGGGGHGPHGDGFGHDFYSRIGGPDASDARARASAGRGRAPQATAASSGALMGAKAGLGVYEKIGERYGLRVSSGLRPGAITASGNVSLHSSGDAIDEAGSAAGMLKYARFLAQRYGSGLDELIHTPLGYGIKNGQRVPLSFWGATINAEHGNHVHVGDRTPPTGGAAGGIGGVGGGVGSPQSIHLRSRASGLPGVPGALADAAGSGMARGMEAAINRMLGGGGGGGAGGFNHGYPMHLSGTPGATLTPAQVAKIASSVGLPGTVFAQIAHGESGYMPGIQQRDPGDGNVGYGLFQITPHAWGSGSAAFSYMQSLGGIPAMFNPVKNAQMAKYLYDHAGHSIAPWHGTRYVTGDGTGHDRGYLGAFRRGGSFITRKGRGGIFVAGEGPNQEEVIVRQHRPRGRPAHRTLALGGHHVQVSVTMGGVTVRETADIDRIAEKVADKAGEKVLAALQAGGNSEEELMN